MKVILGILLTISLVLASDNDLQLAKRYYRDEVFKSAADHYRLYLEANPSGKGVAEARLGLARSLGRAGEKESAARVYQDFLMTHSQHEEAAEAGFEFAELMVDLGNNSRGAELFYTYATQRTGVKAQKALWLAIREAFNAKEYESAKSWSAQYFEKYRSGADIGRVTFVAAKLKGQESRWDEAIDGLKKALAYKPEKEEERQIRLFLARALMRSNKTSQAAEEFKKMLTGATKEDSTNISNEYASFLYENKFFGELSGFLMGRESAALGADQLLWLAEARVEVKQFASALKLIEGASALSEKDLVRAGFLKARALMGLGERGEGIQVLTRLGQSGHPEAWILAAESYAQDGMFQQAIQSYYNAMGYLKEDRNKIPLILKIAAHYENDLRRFGVARSVYEDFTKNYPSSQEAAEAAMGIARCLEAEDKLSESAAAYNRVVEDFPSHRLAQEAKARWEYLSKFKIRLEGPGMEHLLVIIEKGDYPEKQIHVGRVFEEDLKDHDKALKVYQRFLEGPVNDSVLKLQALYRKGRMQELLAEKASYEKDLSAQLSFKNLAIKSYEELIAKYPNSDFRDDAEFHLMALKPFDLAAWSAFPEKFPQSNRLPEVLLRLGDSYIEQARTLGGAFGEKAAVYYQKLLKDFPKSELRTQAMIGISDAYYRSGKYDLALPTLKILVNTTEENYNLKGEALLLQGKIFIAQKDYNQAVSAFKEVLFKYGASASAPEATYLMANSWAALKKQSEASNYYRAYVSRYANGDQILLAYIGLSQLYEAQQEWAKAIAPIQEFIATSPHKEDLATAYERLGVLEQSQNSREEAARAFANAIHYGGNNKSYLLLRTAEIYLQIDLFDSAYVYYNRAQKVSADPREKGLIMGGRLTCMVMLGKKKEFNDLYKTFKKDYEDDKELHARIIYYEGRHLMDSKEEDRARKRFSYLADRFEESSWAAEGLYYLGAIAYQRGKYRDALNSFSEYEKKNPNGRSIDQTLFKMGSCHYQLKSYASAAEYYSRALNLNKGELRTRYLAAYNAAISYEKLNEWSKAAYMYHLINDKYSRFLTKGGILVSAGFSWFNAGEFHKARETFQAALKDTNSERRAEAHYWYAKSLDHTNQVEDAIAEYLKVSYLYPDDPMWGLTGIFEVGQIYERSGDIERARRMYEKIVTQDGLHGSLGSRAAKYLENMGKKPGGGAK
jgi:TolA-binding protein